MKIDIPDAFPGNKYIADSSLVYMTRGSGSYFNVTVGTNSEIGVTKSYENGSTDKDWLKIETPAITDNLTKALSSKTYNFKIVISDSYDGEDAPRATVTFTDKAQGISKTIYVKRLDSDIKANGIKFAAKANQDTTLKATAPNGCNILVDWNGGDQWFTLNKTNLSASDDEQDIKITQKPNLTGLTMKPATVTFKNGKPENGDRAITITPTGFTAPLLVTQIDTTFAHAVLNNQTQSLKFTVTEAAYLGNIGTPTGDTAKVSISIQEKKIIIKVKNKDYLPATLQIPNRSDSTKVSTIKITGVIDKKYEGEDVWCYGDVLVAPKDAATGINHATAMATPCPDGWHIPSDWTIVCGGPNTSGTNIQELEKNNVFADGAYWAVMSAGGAYHYILSVVSGKINAYAHSDQAANLRCVHE